VNGERDSERDSEAMPDGVANGSPPEPLPGSSSLPSGSEKEKRARAICLPRDFTVTAEMYQWALGNESLGKAAVDRLSEAFEDWARGRGKKYQDWVATWRNWIRARGYQRGTVEKENPKSAERQSTTNRIAQNIKRPQQEASS